MKTKNAPFFLLNIAKTEEKRNEKFIKPKTMGVENFSRKQCSTKKNLVKNGHKKSRRQIEKADSLFSIENK